jgi:hypothetical protein
LRDFFRRDGEWAPFVLGFLAFVRPQFLRLVGPDFRELPVAGVVQPLAFAELAGVELLLVLQVAWRGLDAVLRLAQLELEGVGLLLALDELALDALVLRESGEGRHGGQEEKIAHHRV